MTVEELGWETVAALDERELALLRHILRNAKPARLQWPEAQRLNNLAKAHYTAKDYGQALHCVKQATDLYPQFDEAWYLTGVILSALDKHAIASDAMARSLALRPLEKQYWWARARVQFKARRC
ncbi:MAG TPA: tetratricopeptide repeat protein, partial [Ktedonobacterales bacterium]